jgi:cell division protein FtsI/penicillin-binding protein 2
VKHAELLRVRVVFGALGMVPVFLTGWFAWVQVAQCGELERAGRAPLALDARTADRQAARRAVVPAPRATIVDRHGAVLAIDCEAYDVRARIAVPNQAQRSVAGFRAYLGELAADLADAMVADPELADRAATRRVHLREFVALLAKEFAVADLPADGPLPERQPRSADVRIAGEVDALSVVEALRELGERRSSVTMHFLRTHRRVYPERDLTHGFVGHAETLWQTTPNGGQELVARGICGLESFAAVDAGPAVVRPFVQDGKGRPYFRAPVVGPPKANVLHATLDLELQRAAVRELSTQAEAGAREGKVTIPQWGALVLVEVATGDVLAAASWHRDSKHPKNAAFSPLQSLYEPGSIVKPLVFAFASEAGVCDWSREYDCRQGSDDYRGIIGAVSRRTVRDDHDCALLTPHGILVNSSNIGASYIGLGLDREQWRDYMRSFGFGESLGLHFPNERRGGTPKQSFDPAVPMRSFLGNSAISFSFGYELQVTALHMARAYLRLFRGADAALRVCRGLDLGGDWHAAPVTPSTRAFRPEVVEAVRAAMVDVVSADPHATGCYLHGRVLKEMGIDLHGVIAGKTGTAASDIGLADGRRVNARNASFVGFLPVESPRWLAVCVLQKDDSARFYGGSYAAPPVVRLLLQTQRLEERRRLRQESLDEPDGQVRSFHATPGDSGWSRGVPETTLVGR